MTISWDLVEWTDGCECMSSNWRFLPPWIPLLKAEWVVFMHYLVGCVSDLREIVQVRDDKLLLHVFTYLRIRMSLSFSFDLMYCGPFPCVTSLSTSSITAFLASSFSGGFLMEGMEIFHSSWFSFIHLFYAMSGMKSLNNLHTVLRADDHPAVKLASLWWCTHTLHSTAGFPSKCHWEDLKALWVPMLMKHFAIVDTYIPWNQTHSCHLDWASQLGQSCAVSLQIEWYWSNFSDQAQLIRIQNLPSFSGAFCLHSVFKPWGRDLSNCVMSLVLVFLLAHSCPLSFTFFQLSLRFFLLAWWQAHNRATAMTVAVVSHLCPSMKSYV